MIRRSTTIFYSFIVIISALFIGLFTYGKNEHVLLLDRFKSLKLSKEEADPTYGLKASDWIGLYSLEVSSLALLVSIIGTLVTFFFSYIIYRLTKQTAERDETSLFLAQYNLVMPKLKRISYILSMFTDEYKAESHVEIRWNVFTKHEVAIHNTVKQILENESLGEVASRPGMIELLTRLELQLNKTADRIAKLQEVENAGEQIGGYKEGYLTLTIKHIVGLKAKIDLQIKTLEERHKLMAKRGRLFID
ncbi:hypothetical protein NGI46_13855 [Peribacillus butanolivorans]|uniref:hypothetical protein n=1 Tax=Peribacillus butanolivorans TaxID=421767 RepID=UPI00207C9C94|nr:hypothetical protein [Peribacillus butanolivorans]MCO0598517.1 hypothetical protein [Peribacillus butanolivorans]